MRAVESIRRSFSPHELRMPTNDISVLIPAYNAEEFIVDALESVLRQTQLPREVLIINDGSSDQTFGVVKDWIEKTQSKYPVFILHTQDNKGIAATRNIGISRASCRWIALLDADDIWESNHLSELCAAAAQIPSAVATYGAGRLLVGAVVSEQYYDDFWDNPSRRFGMAIAESHFLRVGRTIVPRLIKGNFIKPSSLMLDRVVACEIGPFNETLRTSEDREFLVRLVCKGDFVYSPMPITQYRWHDNNLSQVKNAKRNSENELRALLKLSQNEEFILNRNEQEACQIAIQAAVKEYFYICACSGLRSYVSGMGFVRKMFEVKVLVTAISIRHILRSVASLGKIQLTNSNT